MELFIFICCFSAKVICLCISCVFKTMEKLEEICTFYQIMIPRVLLPFNHHYVIKWKLISKLAKDTYLVCVSYLVYKVVISVCLNVSSIIQKSLADLSQICWVWNSLEPRDCSLLGLTFFSCVGFYFLKKV